MWSNLLIVVALFCHSVADDTLQLSLGGGSLMSTKMLESPSRIFLDKKPHTCHPNKVAQGKGKLRISILNFDHDFGNNVTFATLFILGICTLIVIFVLGLVALHSWEAESFLHCLPWATPSSPCGQF
jgi:hypothetical protein